METRILSQQIFYMFCVCIPFLIRPHRYANFVLILISFQVTDYKIDNYNISKTANQRKGKKHWFPNIWRDSQLINIRKNERNEWTIANELKKQKMDDWFWETICKKWVTGFTIISTKWQLTKTLIEIWMVHGERKNFDR